MASLEIRLHRESKNRAPRLRLFVIGLGLMCCVMSQLFGCATIGREFPVSQVPEIRLGETTQAEIRALFGEPWRVGIEDGLRTWTYGRYRYRLFGRARTEDLVLRFDAQGVVASYTFNTTEHDQ